MIDIAKSETIGNFAVSTKALLFLTKSKNRLLYFWPPGIQQKKKLLSGENFFGSLYKIGLKKGLD